MFHFTNTRRDQAPGPELHRGLRSLLELTVQIGGFQVFLQGGGMGSENRGLIGAGWSRGVSGEPLFQQFGASQEASKVQRSPEAADTSKSELGRPIAK